MEVYRQIEEIVADTLQSCVRNGDIPPDAPLSNVTVEKPKRAEHGDFATTICLRLAKAIGKNPRQIAQSFIEQLVDPNNIVEKCDIAGPGFINFTVRSDVWLSALGEVPSQGDRFGCSEFGEKKRVLVEFVSANPTGPLHVGHGRGAVIGDATAALLEAAGYDVDREYYINDVGNQMNILGNSLFVRYQQACGRDIEFPENHYKGDYVNDVAAHFKAKHGESLLEHDYKADPTPFINFIKDAVLEEIKDDLQKLGIRYDNWFSEKTLHESGRLDDAVSKLTSGQYIRTDEAGRQWFESSRFGDNEDRVVVRDTGIKTYFAADIAYHEEKFSRGYDLCINVWGADHHGYIPRVKASIEAMGRDPDKLEILLYQFVSLVEAGQPVRMSTRGGTFETLSDLIDEVGADATRYNFVMRKSEAQFEFDLALAKSQSLDNPVYYVQYGHARICQIIAKGAEAGHNVPSVADVDLSPLTLPDELALVKQALDYPWVIRSAAEARAPHHVAFYLQELIGTFHGYYTKYKHSEKVVSDDAAKTSARLFLCNSLRIVLSNALRILGVSAPERMYFTE